MVYKFGPNEQCLRRCRAIVPVILRAAEEVTIQGVRVLVEHQDVVRPLMGWWQFTNRTAQALVSLYDQGYTVEAAPLMRNLMGHAYAMNWLADNGVPAVVALTDYWREHRRKLAKNVNETWNLPEPTPVPSAEPIVFANPESERIHKKLCGELKNFDTMVTAYGTADVYPVYRHQSAYSHTTGATADAFLIMDDGKLKFTTEPKGGEADVTAERLWIPVALLQAAAAISPMLTGHPMKSTIDKALGDLGLPRTLLNLQRSRPL
ncbi:DUF5677 domain-containing protein [Streptomyces phaeochromogenes]|uniref:DUF5677 domain-containing protein n=1 Tax=Streptomyces phaeochromogenes TaxID=1923 RepID=UPI002DDBCF28|nr:DUF5677 domain-containing protein [Streptomyces phaeochromogenes]WRZ28733.1 DUF5677 domain-containing protein [Streptomyces phaeochromogenes]